MKNFKRKILAVLATTGFVGAAGFMVNSALKLDSTYVQDSRPSPQIETIDQSQKLAEQEKESIQLKRQNVIEKLGLMSQKLNLLQNDLDRAKSQFKLAVDRAIGTPQKQAQMLLSDLKIYNASEASFEARAEYTTKMAGTMAAMGASSLPFPERNPAYLDKLHSTALMYRQSLDAFESDILGAKLQLDNEIGRVQKEFISMQIELQNVQTNKLDLGDLERAACDRAIKFAQSLGPFLTHDLIPALPLSPSLANQDKPQLSVGLLEVSQWIEQAHVNTEGVLEAELETQLSSPVFMAANKLVYTLERRGEP
ncbi:MAG: hypothetical protein LW720_10660 [Pirellula sp.]|jgi:hypothetical protein|nr:hypothetical protein [Pirellula sp.]